MPGFTCDAKALQGVLKDLSRSAARHHYALPVLTHAKVCVVSIGWIGITATDLDFTTTRRLEGEDVDRGEFLVPVRTLADVLAAMRPGHGRKITLAVDPENETVLHLTMDDGGTAELPTMAQADFPPLPMECGDPDATLEWDLAEWCANFSQVASCAAVKQDRPTYAGVLLSLHDQRVEMVATDGHRMGVRVFGGEHGMARDAIIPARLAKLLPSHPAAGIDLLVELYKNQARLVWDGTEIVARLIDAAYPNWQKVLPEQTPHEIACDRDELHAAVRAVAPMARDAAHVLRLTFGEGSLTLRTGSDQDGSAERTVPAQLTRGEAPDGFALNVDYLAEALPHFGPGPVALGIKDHLAPILFTGANAFRVVIMPVRVAISAS